MNLGKKSLSMDDLYQKENLSVGMKVLFFARARDLTGLTDISPEVSSGSTAHDRLNKLISNFPNSDEIRGCMVLALNEECTTESAIVKDRDVGYHSSNKRRLRLKFFMDRYYESS